MKKAILKATKLTTITVSMMLFVVGTYNAFFMNSLEFMSDSQIKFAKRLEEINGRIVAAKAPYKEWTYLSDKKPEAKTKFEYVQVKKVNKVAKLNNIKKIEKTAKAETVKSDIIAQPVISTNLELKLAEVFNVKKYPNPLNTSQFSGELFTANGVIESLNVQLPNNEEIEISFAEMAGNVFNYESQGEQMSGMIYEVSKGTYMVTLTNGPFSGTRMKFLSDEVNMPTYEMAENNSENTWDQNLNNDQNLQDQAQAQVQANGNQMPQQPFAATEQAAFNFEQQQVEI